ncbi:SusC/RagA family TonB-linked outer membrane protein [Parabacteroides pacaensis]|uniref:SusC/RagA family TonB-linked outer membrane protein n=1 Tax=Parabacteroides pacaensis TaxID=2086575 RepID=UPI000D0E662D|nr:SusC/RagA family TonB-linked outer membrane protein [Parabacteroides pacaensis]
MKRFILFILFTSIYSIVSGQELAVTVQVVDEWDHPLPGVEMTFLDNPAISFVSGEEGFIHFQAVKGTKVKFRIVGKLTRTMEITSSNMTVKLGPNNRMMDIGFGETLTKETSTASVVGVTEKEIGRSGQFHVLNSLYGLLPGLSVRQSGTVPWSSGPAFNIRGEGSFQGNSILVLVDGVERDISRIDREEIESVTVLKDAASLALYGLRGADGVISLTSKRGSNQKLRTKINYQFTVQTPFRLPEMADAPTYAQAVNEALKNDGMQPRYTEGDITAMRNGTRPYLFPNINWVDEIMRKAAFNNELNVSFDGNNKRMRYYVLANYTSNRGLLNQTDLNDGYSTQLELFSLKIRSNLEIEITRTTRARVNLMGRLLQYQQPTAGSGFDAAFQVPACAFPIQSEDKLWVQSQMFINPLADKTAKGYSVLQQRTLFADVTVAQDLSMLTPGLSAELLIAHDNSAEYNDTKSREYAYEHITPRRDQNGMVLDSTVSRYGNDTGLSFSSGLSWQVMRTTVRGKLNYLRNWNRHTFNSALIYSQDKAIYLGANNTYMHRDFIGKAGYNYDGRYLADIVLSFSGGSRLPEGNKYRIYPAVSAAWILSNEKFLKENATINFLKLRASYGIVGMDSHLSYDMDKQFNNPWGGRGYLFTNSLLGASGASEGALPSPNVQPEKDYKTNVGLEIGIWNGLTAELEGFYNHRTHIRVGSGGTTSSVLGIGTPDIFTGEVNNWGLEASLGWQQQIDKFQYYINGNISFARNKIINLEEAYVPHEYMKYTGQRIGTYYGLKATGLFQTSDFDADGNLLSSIPNHTFKKVQPGDIRYEDLNKDNKIDEYDACYQLNPGLPEIYFGINLGMEYNNWGLNANFQGTAKSTIQPTLGSIYWPLYNNDKNISTYYLENRWTEDTPYARYPRLTTLANANNFRSSTLWTRKGDYFKLRVLEVYYKLPEKITGKLKMNECKFFFKGMNLFSIDDIGIMDPEFISTGYPSTRSYLIGLNVLF